MKRIKLFNRKKVIDSALGKIPFDLVIVNCKIVNVLTGEIYPGEVGITDGYIAHINCNPDDTKKKFDSLNGKTVYDGKENYLIPGFIDAHMHIESSMLNPRKFAELVTPYGTTTIVADPHEIGNVFGVQGVKYMFEASENLPMRQFFLVPSCVPSVEHLESSGCEISTNEIEELLKLKRVLGLGEVMDYVGVIDWSERMQSILTYANEKEVFIQGHAPNLSGRNLSAYLIGGPNSDHESVSAQEATEKIRNGMFIDARESSISKNIEEIVKGTTKFKYLDFLTFCTDDREVDDILEFGHINDVVRCAIKYGMEPIDAIRSATINIAREIGYKDLGAIAPGFVGDLVLIDNLKDLNAKAVFFQGQLVAENGKLLSAIEPKSFELEKINSINIRDIKLNDLEIIPTKALSYISTNVLKYPDKISLITELSLETLPIIDGKLNISEDKNLKYVAIINRYGKNNITLGVVRNFGTEFGAFASTVSHDCHNLVIVYDTPENALIAIEEIKKNNGGMTTVINGKVIKTLALPIAGLMTNKNGVELAKDSNELKNILKKMGLKEIPNPLLRIATLALPVIPNIKISDKGIIDVNKQTFIPLFNK